MHNTCEDSLLASPLIIDLVILAELSTRITYQCPGQEREGFHSVLSLLSYLLKAVGKEQISFVPLFSHVCFYLANGQAWSTCH